MSLNFNLSLSGIRAGEKMIQVTQNNIANASNTSYARQRVELIASNYPSGNSGINAQLGSGVSVEQISRIKDDLLTQQSRTESGIVGYYTASSDVLSNIETIFNETGDNSVSQLMTNFFNSFEEASKFPEQSSYRLSATYAGKMFAEKIQGISHQIDQVKDQTDTKLTTEVDKVNDLLGKIANVNQKMENVYSDNANALMDERDKYIDELSQYMDVQVVNKSNPMNMELKMGNATLLSGKNVYNVKPMYIADKDKWVLSASDIEFKPQSGSLAGILTTRNTTIDSYQNDLNTLVSNLITQVNAQHSSGFGLDGSTGLNFFTGTDIRTIGVNPIFESNPEKLALSSASGVTGNSDIASNISALKDSKFVGGKNPVDYYQAYTVRLASDLNVTKENGQIHTDVQQAMESQRQDVQGVNIDEEMSNLLQFQKYYQANTKTLTTVNKMMDDLLTII